MTAPTEEQPKTFGCNHNAETCMLCHDMVMSWKAAHLDRLLPQVQALTHHLSQNNLGTWGEDCLPCALELIKKGQAQEAELYAAQDQVTELQSMMEASDKAIAHGRQAISERDALLAQIALGLLTSTEIELKVKQLNCKHETWLGHSGTGRIFCADCSLPKPVRPEVQP